MNPIHSPKRHPFCWTYLNAVTLQETIEWANLCIQQRTAVQLIAASADLYVSMRRNAALRDIVNACPMIHAGDRAVALASRMLGIPLPARITQAELVDKLLALANQRRYRIFLVGEEPEVLQRAEMYIRLFYPYLQVSGSLPARLYPHEEANALQHIAQSGADMLFVALPSPEREIWLHSCLDRLNVPLSVGADGAFADYAAFIRQAPAWIKGTVLEQIFLRLRLNRTQRRTIKSYPAFWTSIVREWSRHKKGRNG